jgi:hypothetical protein
VIADPASSLGINLAGGCKRVERTGGVAGGRIGIAQGATPNALATSPPPSELASPYVTSGLSRSPPSKMMRVGREFD